MSWNELDELDELSELGELGLIGHKSLRLHFEGVCMSKSKRSL